MIRHLQMMPNGNQRRFLKVQNKNGLKSLKLTIPRQKLFSVTNSLKILYSPILDQKF